MAAANVKSYSGSKKVWFFAGGVILLAVIAGVVAFIAFIRVFSPPAATTGKLLAAAKEGYGKSAGVQFTRELCLSNMNYGVTNVNVSERDQGTQTWLNALVAAGLYSPPVPINSGGYSPQTLQQYVATPELAKWRDGSRLCLTKDVEFIDVVDIEKPQEQAMGQDTKGDSAKLLTVKATLVLQSTDVAPWLEKAEVQAAVVGRISGWEYKNAKFQKRMPDTFGLRDDRWATGPVYKASLQRQYQANLRNNKNDDDGATPGSVASFIAGLGNKLSSIFASDRHPLEGVWEMDTQTMGTGIGMSLPSGLGLGMKVTFTFDSLEVMGKSVKCKFEVDGKKVKVIPEGQPVSLIFMMADKDTASIDLGIFKLQYKRVT